MSSLMVQLYFRGRDGDSDLESHTEMTIRAYINLLRDHLLYYTLHKIN